VSVADRVPNLVLAEVRDALNLSQEEFAARIRAAGAELGEPNDCNKRQVQRWELGETRSARPVYRRALERATGRRYAELGFHGGERSQSAVVDRRTVLGSSAMFAALLAAAPHVDQLTAGRRIDAGAVEAIRVRTARFRRLDDHLGGADTYRLYIGELESTGTLLDRGSYTEATGRQLAGLYAEQAQQAGWAAFDAGWQAQAEQLYRASLDAARVAGDAPLAGNALALLAYQAGATGRDSVETAAAAYREAGPHASAGVRALLLQRLAWAHAIRGQITGAVQALQVAGEAVDEHEGTETPDWAAWADGREQRIITGRCWSELGRPLRAVPILESVLGEYEDSHARDKAMYLTWLAGAYVDAGEVEQAAVTTARALDLAADVASARPAQRVAVVVRRLEPHRGLPAVRALLERASAA
jgi:tetratricopeptide (TPR) repeat protein